ncbi:hypothetical protein VitviT2T_030146 [Vitis vinifera]|uniref:Uncharacterized protein n=2 Tax=Vitis vinifera TaxID=29760 RepID=A0ABY9DZN8_VITVI|nr:hypothetical protein VitviT2T_030146 [Vitis vinifera]
MQRRYVAVRGASLAGGAFQSWLGDILESRLLLEAASRRGRKRASEKKTWGACCFLTSAQGSKQYVLRLKNYLNSTKRCEDITSGFGTGSKEGNVMCMNGYFMKEAFLFNGDPGIVGIYSGFTSFSIPEALKQATGNHAAEELGKQVHGYMTKIGFDPSSFAVSTLVHRMVNLMRLFNFLRQVSIFRLPFVRLDIGTVDPLKELPFVIANTVLSILAVDYPVDKASCYVLDDGSSMLTFEALSETSEFARKWVLFCKKYGYLALDRIDFKWPGSCSIGMQKTNESEEYNSD